MDRFEDLTTARAQLYGSFLVVVAVLSGGIDGFSTLGDKLEHAGEQAEQTRNRCWIGNLVDQSVDEISAADLKRSFGSGAFWHGCTSHHPLYCPASGPGRSHGHQIGSAGGV